MSRRMQALRRAVGTTGQSRHPADNGVTALQTFVGDFVHSAGPWHRREVKAPTEGAAPRATSPSPGRASRSGTGRPSGTREPSGSPSEAPERIPLSGQDEGFLAWESAARPMHIGMVVTFRVPADSAQPDIDTLRTFFSEKLRDQRHLHTRLIRGGLFRENCWEPIPDLRIEDHIVSAAPQPGEGEEALRRYVDAILTGALDDSIPLWQIFHIPSVPRPDTFVLVVKVHHTVLDGTAGMALMEAVFGDSGKEAARSALEAARVARDIQREGDTRVESSGAAEPGSTSSASTLTASAGATPGIRPTVAGDTGSGLLPFFRTFLRILGGKRGTFMTGVVTEQRNHRWFRVDADRFEAAARKANGTRNDAILAAVAGALGRWMPTEHDAPLPETLRALCPVDGRGRGKGGLGNRVLLWFVDLPVREPDPLRRVAALRRSTTRHKKRNDAKGGVVLARLVKKLGPWVAALTMKVTAARGSFHILTSSLDAPDMQLSLNDAVVESVVPFAPLFPAQRVGLTIARFAGELHVGVNDGFEDPSVADRFAARLEEAFHEIMESVEAGS